MQSIEFSFEFSDLGAEEIHSFSFGNILIKGDKEILSSKNHRGKDASMMILPSIVELLDGIRKLLRDKSVDTYNFVGMDSSFQFFVRQKGNSIYVEDLNKVPICQCTTIDFLNFFWQATSVFLEEAISKLDSDEVIYNDLLSARKDFVDAFNL